MATSVRTAAEADIDEILRLARAMHAESPRYRNLPFSEARTEEVARRLIAAPEAVVLLAETAEGVVGVLAAFVAEHIFSDVLYAADVAVFVEPIHRGGTAAVRLLHAYEAWAKGLGVRESVLGVSTEVTEARTVSMYQRLGYTVFGTNVRKAL